MTTATVQRSNLIGAAFALAAVMCFSINDVGIKFLSGDYALHQIVLIRTLVAITIFCALIMPFNGGLSVLRTRRPGAHLLRGICVVLANTFLFLGLSAMPIADAVAVFFISPLVITVFSVIFLRETVGLRRWAAIIVGFVGVMIIVKPGTSAFQVASLFPMVAAVLYAVMHMVARKVGGTESAPTMAIYIMLTFLVASTAMGLATGGGRYAHYDHPSAAFLLRVWGPIDPGDWPLLILLGVSGLFGGLFISQAYRLSEAAFAAPFEYVAMPMAIMWGVTVFGTWPDRSAWIGIALIIGSGLYLLWRESVKDETLATDAPTYRR
ncbi:Threonine/homoserine efflux transporter RhtA [Roseovarius marisflavi]|uniref:Threonine/homoserine efflux transporter RhtA n=1 Tax=Roseovarius marisflavi TaxID=1054996 RepID=A0A1M6ZCP7_9RHOB|nr:DMT family transporter [Roseovarius marisflavi]SHL28296.1 Threonine/homoserine efflux transporter RhtA [Roseovarius marisflavi]